MKKYFEVEPRFGRFSEEVVPVQLRTTFHRPEDYRSVIRIGRVEDGNIFDINGDKINLRQSDRDRVVIEGEGTPLGFLNRNGFSATEEVFPDVFRFVEDTWTRGGEPPQRAIVQEKDTYSAYRRFKFFWYTGVPEVFEAALAVYHKEHGSIGRLKKAVRAL